MCCSVLQCVAVCCSVLQCVAVSFNLNLQSQSNWSFVHGTWQSKRRELDHRLSFGIGEMTLQMQQAVPGKEDELIHSELYANLI